MTRSEKFANDNPLRDIDEFIKSKIGDGDNTATNKKSKPKSTTAGGSSESRGVSRVASPNSRMQSRAATTQLLTVPKSIEHRLLDATRKGTTEAELTSRIRTERFQAKKAIADGRLREIDHGLAATMKAVERVEKYIQGITLPWCTR